MVTLVTSNLRPPSHRKGGNGYNTFVSQSGEHDAELSGLAWFELRYLVQYTTKRKVGQHCTLRMVYPGPEGCISH